MLALRIDKDLSRLAPKYVVLSSLHFKYDPMKNLVMAINKENLWLNYLGTIFLQLSDDQSVEGTIGSEKKGIALR